jgi:predicted RNA binding protein YcfA (HicA-like mRNA interferase family)/predicted DNA-binding protein YlxM (UPF0122 family)
MEYLTVYENTEVTNEEMLEAIKALGFVQIENNNAHYFYLEHPVCKLTIDIPKSPLDGYIPKFFTAKYSYQLEMFELIKHRDDLVKKILRERSKKNRALRASGIKIKRTPKRSATQNTVTTNYLSVYKETQVTIGEMIEAIKSLGYVQIAGDDARFFDFAHPTCKLPIIIPQLPLTDYIAKHLTAKYSYQLEMVELIKHRDDLVKGILKERAKKKRALKKQQQELAAA